MLQQLLAVVQQIRQVLLSLCKNAECVVSVWKRRYAGEQAQCGIQTTLLEPVPTHGSTRTPFTRTLISAAPIPDPRVERIRNRIRVPGDLISSSDPEDALRFLPPGRGQPGYGPRLQEIKPDHCVAKQDPLETILAARTNPGTPRSTVD